MEQQAQDWFAVNAPKSPPPAAPPAEPKQAAANTDWFAANAPKTPAAPDTDGTSPTDMHSLASQNPNNEGLYHMKDANGHSFAIPYSNVEMVDDFRNSFVDEGEAKKYEKDRDHAEPGWKDKILAHTNPLDDAAKEQIKQEAHKLPDWMKDSSPKEKHDWLANADSHADSEVQAKDFERGFANGAGSLVLHPWESIKTAVNGAAEAGSALILGRDNYDKEAASDAPQWVKDAFKDKDNFKAMLADMKKQFGDKPSYAMGQLMGQAIVTHGAGKVVKALPYSAGKIAGKTVVKAAEGLRRTVGTDVRATEDIARKIKTANEKAELEYKEASPERQKQLDQVIADNNEKLKAHEQAVKDRTELVQKHVDASRKAAESKARLANHVNDIHDSAVKWFGQQYDTLGELTKDVRVPFSPLTDAVEEANLQDIAGSDTKVPVFEDVLKRSKGEINEPAQKPKGWESASKDEKDEWEQKNLDQTGISYKDLTGYYRELGKILKSPSTLGDVKDAVVRVRSKIEELQRSAAQLADEKAAAKAAANKQAAPRSAAQLNYSLSEKYKNFAQSYREAGSPGYKAVNATNIDEATKPFLKNMEDGELSDVKQQVRGRERADGKKTNATEWAGRNSASDTAGKSLKRSERRAQTEKLIDQTRKAHEDLKALPKPGAPPTPPEPTPLPEPEPPAPETISPEMLKIKKQQAIDNFFESLRKNRVRIGISGFGTLGLAELVSHAMSHMLGTGAGAVETIGMGLAGAQIFGPTIMTKLLKVPGVIEALKIITKAETEMLEKLSPPERVAVEKNIVSMTQVAKAKGLIKPSDPTPMAKWAKADMAKVKAAEAIKEETPPPVEEPPVTDRRVDAATRQRVDEMTPEQMRSELLTSPKVDLPQPSRVDQAPASKAVAMSDADGLKAFNDRFGYEAGDQLLKAKAEALKEAGLDAYHDKGDEFLYRGETEESLKTKLEAARDILRKRIIEVKTTDGQTLQFNGADFSFGTGDNLETAETGLKEHKSAREASGERKRGELRGIAEVGSGKSPVDQGTAAKPSVNRGEVDADDLEPGDSGRVAIDALHVDPERFQYKLNPGEKGVTNQLQGKKWDENLAGVIQVWRDPKDGELYVVNGHHRVEMANRMGVKNLQIRVLDAPNATAARQIGALQNIAEGNGTVMDAAKYFRDSKLTEAQIKNDSPLSIGSVTVRNGIKLASLSDDLFQDVATGRLPERTGLEIAQNATEHWAQEATAKEIRKYEASGRTIKEGTAAELARGIQAEGATTRTESTLFGDEEFKESLAVPKAEVRVAVRKELMKGLSSLRGVSTEAGATAVGDAGAGSVDAAKAAEVVNKQKVMLAKYDKLSVGKGQIDAAITEAARTIEDRGNRKSAIESAVKEIRDALD